MSFFLQSGAALHQMPGLVVRTQIGFQLPPAPSAGFFVQASMAQLWVGALPMSNMPVCMMCQLVGWSLETLLQFSPTPIIMQFN